MLKLRKVKLTYKRVLVRLSLIILFASGVTPPALIPSPLPVLEAEAQTCSPGGYYYPPGRIVYDWIANGDPSGSSCWSHEPDRVAIVPTTCPGSSAWEFKNNGYITQTFTIPSDWTQPNFVIQYTVDFDDPNNDPWNRFAMQVYDMTTGALLVSDFYSGNMGDLYCSSRAQFWSQNLAGHQLLVRFQGTRAYSNTLIRVRGISVFQQLSP